MSNGGTVFVHCYAGVSRSAAIVIAYMMQEHSMNMFEALHFVKQKRNSVFPNAGFQRQLMDFEKKLADQRAFNKKVLGGELSGYGLKSEKKESKHRYSELKKIFAEYKEQPKTLTQSTPKTYSRKEV
jgi:hypothetical protein